MTTTGGELLEERTGHRRTLVRMALMYTPFALVGVGLLSISLWSLFQGNLAALVPVTILGMIVLALVFQALSALRDLRSTPTISTGEVRRTWTKGTVLWFFRSHYVLIGRNVFDVAPVTHIQIQEGDFLEIKHWPHTKGVISVHLLRHGPDSARTQEVPGGARRRQEDYWDPEVSRRTPEVTDVAMGYRYGFFPRLWGRWRKGKKRP